MNCPQCNSPLKIIQTKSHYGKDIELDQCSTCGGIWIDQHEVYEIPVGHAAGIDSLSVEKVGTSAALPTQPLHCPRDHAQLYQFSDANFPKHIIIERCSACKGFWFNSGELSEYRKTMHTRQQQKDFLSYKMFPRTEDQHMLIGLCEFLSMRINQATRLPEDWGIPGFIEPSNEYMREARNTYYLLLFLMRGLGL